MIDYIFYTFVSLGCSYLVYFFILKQEKTFQFNRFFLLVSISLCLLAPLLEINTIEALPSITEISLQDFEKQHISEEIIDIGTIVETETSRFTLSSMLWYAYLVISMGFLLRFTKNLVDIIKLTKQNHYRLGNLKLVETNDHKNASSFFNYLFINSESLINEDYSKSIIQHELVHSQEWHTLDVIFMELLLCFFWFNPFMQWFKKAIIQNHEFIADSQTVASGIDLQSYSQTIITSGHKEYRVPLTSGFNFIQIKNRIIMLHQSKSSPLKRTLKITLVTLLFAGIFVFSCTYKDINNEPFVVVIDAAHGGKDSGNSIEKDVVLDISNILASLADENIQIIQTRSHDEFLALRARVDFINNQKPDLFLSLHCNAYKDESISGVEAYCGTNTNTNLMSLTYAEMLIEHQSGHFSSRGVKQARLYLLNNTEVPGVLLELGFLTNENDRKLLTNNVQQIKIAKSIYAGLMEIRDLQ